MTILFPLIIIICCQAVDVLLAWGADPNLPLSCRVGSALCANANIAYNSGTQPRNRILLVHRHTYIHTHTRTHTHTYTHTHIHLHTHSSWGGFKERVKRHTHA